MPDNPGFMYLAGETFSLALLVNEESQSAIFFHLISSSTPPLNSDTWPVTYQEPTIGGYSPIVLAGGGEWTLGSSSGGATATLDSQSFDFGPYGGGDVSIFGWWMDEPTTQKLVAGGTIAPYLVPHAGGTLVFPGLTITLGACGVAPTNPVALDLFGGSATADLALHPMNVGTGWLREGAAPNAWNIVGGQANCNGATILVPYSQVCTGTVVSDCTVTATITWQKDPAQNRQQGLLVRRTDGSNYLLARYLSQGTGIEGFYLTKAVAGAFTDLVSVLGPVLPGGLYQVVLSSDTIKFYQNSSLLLTAVDGFNQHATQHGFWAYFTDAARWSNFRVDR